MNRDASTLFSAFAILLMAVPAYTQYTESDWDARDKWMDFARIFDWAGVEKGDMVADVGCHEGYLSMRLANRVGTTGKVYSVDVVEDHLSTLTKNAKERKLKNITTVLGKFDDPGLPEKRLDVVFIIDAYHEMDDYKLILEHIKNDLKPGGRIVILEKLKDHARDKSRKEQAGAHTLSPDYVKAELEEAGFVVSGEFKNIGYWENEKNKKIWVLIGMVPHS